MSILFLGTSSGCGKTTVCAMMCRYMTSSCMDVAPFKASNLSLNSIATTDGGEIGMGQGFQALACGIEPKTDMNPVLYKPSGDGRMQLIVNGRPLMDVSKGGYADRDALVRTVKEAFDRISSEHDNVLCEGSGSPVELNLMASDIANTGLMRSLGIPAVLVCDIDRGGAFAALYGTWRLIPDDLKPLMRGFIINRFRGDRGLLKDAIEAIEELTGMRCYGIIRYEHLKFPDEDSLCISEGRLDGTDPRNAFLSNLDQMIEHAEEDGFDFKGLLELIGCTDG